MAKFRKKPVVIEAVRWNGCTVGLTNGREPLVSERLELPDWMPPAKEALKTSALTAVACRTDPAGTIYRDGDFLLINTLEGVMTAGPGDWIIRGIKGELYPCKPDIFDATYEAVAA